MTSPTTACWAWCRSAISTGPSTPRTR
jgi:hypothetical protein